MNYRTAYIRSNRKGLRLKQRVAAAALLGAAVCVALLLRQGDPVVQPAAQADNAAATAGQPARGAFLTVAAAPAEGKRRIYPYSIVPGGVGGRADLMHIIRTDKVVATHYAAFEVEKAHAVTVTTPRAVHVSYRKGDKVYWTAKKLMLAEGETLLTDGQNEIRGRCGNRISDTAQLPVEAVGPTEAELDAGVDEAPGSTGAREADYPYNGDAGGRRSTQLFTYAEGASVFGGSAGGGASQAAAALGGAGSGAYASLAGSGTRSLSGTSAGRGTAATPAVDTAGTDAGSTAGSTSGSTTAGTTGSTAAPVVAATSTGSGGTTETPSLPATAVATTATATPSSGTDTSASGNDNNGSSGSGGTAVTVALPVLLADTAQPETKVEVKAPAPPDTLVQTPVVTVVPAKPVKAAATGDVPEPATLWLGAAGLAAMLVLRRRSGKLAGNSAGE